MEDPRRQPEPLPKDRLALSAASIVLAVAILISALLTGRPLAEIAWLVWLGFGIPIGLFSWYGVLTVRQHTKTHASSRANLKHRISELQDEVEVLIPTIKPTHAWLFYELLVTPQKRIDRITERVQPNSRSLSVRTTLSVSLPARLAPGTIVLPLLTPLKHRLTSGLRIFGADESRLSSLTERKTVAYSAAVVRTLVVAFAANINDYVDGLELDVLRIISEETTRQDRRSVLRRINKLHGAPQDRIFLIWAKQLITALSRRTPICIVADAGTATPGLGPGGEIRAAVEQRLLAAPLRARRRTRTDAKSSVGPYRYFVEFARSVVGVRTTRFYFPLESADRASSYHLEFEGPPGTYLASQAVLEYPTGDDAIKTHPRLPVAFQKRLGQRHGHLYIRGGRRFESRYVRYNFFERVPGSVGPAAASAFAAWLVIWIAVLSSGGGFTTPTSQPHADLVAILFAFPPIAAVWAGLDTQSGLKGGVLFSRIILGLTILISSIAAWLYLVGPLKNVLWLSWLTPHFQWGLVTGTATVTLIAALGSWLIRSVTQHVFMRRSQEV